MANNKQRYVNTRFWNDTYIADLDPIEKLLFIYLLTNEHTNISGVYEIPLKIIAIETGLDTTMLGKILPRISSKINYYKGFVVIKNFIKHQTTDSPNVKKGIVNSLKEVDQDFLKEIVNKGFLALPKDLADTLHIPYIEGRNYLDLHLHSNLDLEHADKSASNKIVFSEEDLELANHLLELIRKNTPTFKEPNIENWANHIRLMRERDNRTPQQIKFVIDWSQKDNFWSANILSTKKLREKFDTLVSQIKRNADKDKIKINSVLV